MEEKKNEKEKGNEKEKCAGGSVDVLDASKSVKRCKKFKYSHNRKNLGEALGLTSDELQNYIELSYSIFLTSGDLLDAAYRILSMDMMDDEKILLAFIIGHIMSSHEMKKRKEREIQEGNIQPALNTLAFLTPSEVKELISETAKITTDIIVRSCMQKGGETALTTSALIESFADDNHPLLMKILGMASIPADNKVINALSSCNTTDSWSADNGDIMYS